MFGDLLGGGGGGGPVVFVACVVGVGEVVGGVVGDVVGGVVVVAHDVVVVVAFAFVDVVVHVCVLLPSLLHRNDHAKQLRSHRTKGTSHGICN